MPAWLTVLPFLVAGPYQHHQGESLVHRAACTQTAQGVKCVTGGAGGPGGNASNIYYFYFGGAQGGNGGPGGSASGGDDETKSARISKCSLKIAGKTIVKATGCIFTLSDREMSIRAPSDRKLYFVRIVFNEDKTGQGYLTGGGTSVSRSLGTMTRHGACWTKLDMTVEVCGHK